MNRTYGRRKPEALPIHRMLTHVSAELHGYIDTRDNCGPIKNQGNEGSCTAHAGTSANEWIHRRYLKSSPIFSPQYTYAQELMLQGNFPQDEGSDGTTLCKTLIVDGSCELSLYPYVEGDIVRPTAEQDTNAAKFTLGAYHGLVGSSVALSVLSDIFPWPVEVGFDVFQSFESDELAETGVMPLPEPRQTPIGGHEVLMVGYDIAEVPTLRPANCGPAALIQNSWGDWGIRGFFWMPLSVLDDPDTDLKIVHSGSPWR